MATQLGHYYNWWHLTVANFDTPYRLGIITTLISQNTANNTSYVRRQAYLYVYGNSIDANGISSAQGYINGNYNGGLSCYTAAVYPQKIAVYNYFHDEYITVNHNAYGNGTVGNYATSWTGFVDAGAVSGNATVGNFGQTFDLPSLARVPTVASWSYSNLGLTSATVSGSVDWGGNNPISQRGFVYSTSSNPTIYSNKLVVSGTTGSMSGNITGLSANTTYYVRAFATNGVGTSYGSNITLKTLRKPSVTTSAVTNNSGPIATFNGNLTDAGNPVITQKGFVYAITANPTIANSKVVVSGTATGAYTANVTGLTSGTTYYVRSFATNSAGTVYGSQVDFYTSKVAKITGSLLFSGTIDPVFKAYRSISGSLLFSGTIKGIKVFDPSVIEKKTYLYKIYDENGIFLEVLDDVISQPMWSEEINEIGSSMTLKLARNSDSTIQKSAPILDSDGLPLKDNNDLNIMGTSGSLKKTGSTSSLQLNNRVDLYVFYGEQSAILDNNGLPILDNYGEEILGTIGSPNGSRKFTGFISEININYGDDENTEIQLMSYGSDLEQYPLVTSDGDTTVPFNSTDPSDMVRTGLTQFIADGIGTYTFYSGATIDSTTTSASYTFRVNTYRELLNKAVQLSPVGWYYRIDLGSNLVHFKNKTVEPQHIFYLGKHIKNLNLRSYIGGIVNDVIFTGGGDPALFRRKTISPITDTRRGLQRESDSRVTLDDSADLLSGGIIDEKKNIQYRTSVEILDKTYDIESINIGDTVGFRNFDNEVDLIVMQIVAKTYTPDIISLQLDTLPKSVPKRVEELRKALNTTENIYVPDSPVVI